MVEKIEYNNQLIALLIRVPFKEEGITFFTDSSFSQQLAFMRHSAGKSIQAHIHQPHKRAVTYTQEVLVIRQGKLRVDFYAENQRYLESRILYAGDVILLAAGGHGFEVLEDLEMFEIKQGPFVGNEDKIRFEGVCHEQIKLVQSKKDDSNVANVFPQECKSIETTDSC